MLVAVSGGLDSVVLLHLLLSAPRPSRPQVVVAHLNHRLRGRASDGDERFVKKLCREWGVPCVTGRARAGIWKKGRENLEARAREARYDFLQKIARKQKIRKIATAHHADDQAETFLIRWLQGAGLKGLGGIPIRRPLGDGRRGQEIVRPLLFVSREEIRRYAHRHRLAHREDATNASEVFLRSRLRRFLRLLRRENPNLAARTAWNSLFLQADEDYLDRVVSNFMQTVSSRGRGEVSIGRRSFRDLPPALRYRLIRRMARQVAGPTYTLPAESVLKIDELTEVLGPRRYDLPGRLGFRMDGRKILIFRRKSD